MLNGPDVDPRP